jgi:hypothetical protein
MNDVVFCKFARSRRWEGKMDFRCEFQFGGLAFGGNEIRPILEIQWLPSILSRPWHIFGKTGASRRLEGNTSQ